MNNGIYVEIGAQVGPLEQGMDRAAKSVQDGSRKMESSLKSASEGMAAAAKSLQAQLAGLFSLGSAQPEHR